MWQNYLLLQILQCELTCIAGTEGFCSLGKSLALDQLLHSLKGKYPQLLKFYLKIEAGIEPRRHKPVREHVYMSHGVEKISYEISNKK